MYFTPSLIELFTEVSQRFVKLEYHIENDQLKFRDQKNLQSSLLYFCRLIH